MHNENKSVGEREVSSYKGELRATPEATPEASDRVRTSGNLTG